LDLQIKYYAIFTFLYNRPRVLEAVKMFLSMKRPKLEESSRRNSVPGNSKKKSHCIEWPQSPYAC